MSLLVFLMPGASDGSEQCNGVMRAAGFAFFEVVSGHSHGVGDMSKAENGAVAGLGKGVKGSGFHLYGVDALGAGGVDRGFGFAVGGVGGPGGALDDAQLGGGEAARGEGKKGSVGSGEAGGGEIMEAGTFVA